MNIISIDAQNIETEHICCAIGNDAANRGRAQSKKDWLKVAFADGLVFKRLAARGKVFIEYMPIEKAWKPVTGSQYLMIHCLWVSGQFKGKGFSRLLLDECVADARTQGMKGLAVVTSKKVKPFLTDKKFFIKQGFTVADTADPYFELLTLRFDKSWPLPQFCESTRSERHQDCKGVTFVYSRQCVFMEEYVHLLEQTAKDLGFDTFVRLLKSADDVKQYGSPFGTLGIYYNGIFLTHELMAPDKFAKLLASCTKEVPSC